MSSEENKTGKSVFIENMAVLTTPEGIQKYLMGTKKNGQPRAVYDIVRDYTKPGKKSKKKKDKGKKDKKGGTSYSFYLDNRNGKKKKKKGKKHWHI